LVAGSFQLCKKARAGSARQLDLPAGGWRSFDFIEIYDFEA
jgi:hypothetical protein